MFRHFRGTATLTLLALGILALIPRALSAQTPTGTISGRVTAPNGQPLAAVEVQLESSSLQKPQATTSSQNGDYIFSLLPPGVYTVSFRLPGFASVKETRDVGATQPVQLDVALKVESVTEAVTVTAGQETFANTSQASTNITANVLNDLPTTRSVTAAVGLAPAVHATGPNNTYSMGGAMSFGNLFMLNGVQTQDNLRGTPFSLYIEDALQETTITTSGASAEYGRFSGGVVNAITKSGGNRLTGSFRTSFANDSWRTVSPFGEPKTNNVVPTYEFTAGGPINSGRTWFFVAGRSFDQTSAEQTAGASLPYNARVTERRFEGKITQSLGSRQRLEVDYTGIKHDEKNSSYPPIMDLASLTNRQLPQGLFSAHYTGALSNNFFLEAQFSARRFSFKNDGGTSRDLIQGTPLIDQDSGASWWSPLFCGVCGSERRDNNELLLKGNYFLSTAAGSHDLTFGVDSFNDVRSGDQHQSGSDYQLYATASVIDNGTVYPVVAGGFSSFLVYWPIGQASLGTNFRTNSAFVNDAWSVNRHVSANLGLRYDHNHGRNSAGQLVARDGAFSPRLGLVFDPVGDGRTTVTASYGRYVDAISNSIADQTSAAGVPSILAYFYGGPDINTDPSQPLVSTQTALQQVFNWFNVNQPDPFQATVPGVTTQIRGSLRSPHADEMAVGVTRQVGHGTLRVDAVDRRFSDFYATRTDTTTGQVTDEFGQVFDLGLVQNTNQLTRRYDALNAQGSYRFGTSVNLGASYTLSRLHGNVDGENITTGPLTSDTLMYPEFTSQTWNNPQGDLAADQRHRARIWGTFILPVGGSRDTVSIGAIEQMQSGTPYGAVGQIQMSDVDGNPYVPNPGYMTPPQTETYYFSSRNAYHTQAMFRTDLSFNYARRTGGRSQVFAQFQILNIFNQFQIFNIGTGSINTKVVTAVDDPALAPFNPFTDTPVEGVNWRFGKRFGKPTASDAYTLPRTFTFSVGLRF